MNVAKADTIVCRASTKLTNAGAGKLVTKGHEFDIGTEYKCSLGGKERTFYVISTMTGKVKMIMDRNIEDTRVAWVKESDFLAAGGQPGWWSTRPAEMGPVTAEKYLKNKTSNWEHVTVSLPSKADILSVNKDALSKQTIEKIKINKVLNNILWTNLGTMQIIPVAEVGYNFGEIIKCSNCVASASWPGYWLQDTRILYNNSRAWYVEKIAYNGRTLGGIMANTNYLDINGKNGVRPVITVAKVRINTGTNQSSTPSSPTNPTVPSTPTNPTDPQETEEKIKTGLTYEKIINMTYEEIEKVDEQYLCELIKGKNPKFDCGSNNINDLLNGDELIDDQIIALLEESKNGEGYEIKNLIEITNKPEGTILDTDVLPTDSQLTVDFKEKVMELINKKVMKIRIFDINLLDEDEKKVNLISNVELKMAIPEEYENKKIAIYRMEKDGSVTKLNHRIEDGYAIFETEHFSIFAMVELEEEVKEEEKQIESTDKKEEKKGVENPQTGAYVSITTIVFLTGIAYIINRVVKKKKKIVKL